MESKQSTYKILQLYAKDIYANTRFDEYGNKAESTFDISLTQKGNANALSSYFKAVAKIVKISYVVYELHSLFNFFYVKL